MTSTDDLRITSSFPVAAYRKCDECGSEWKELMTSGSRTCPQCPDSSGNTLKRIHFGQSEGTIEVAHYDLLSVVLPEHRGDVSEWEHASSHDGPIWMPTYTWLVKALTEPGTNVVDVDSGISVTPRSSSSPVEQLEVWFDSSHWDQDDGKTSIACVANADGERIVAWSRAIASGEGMTSSVGEYCACLSALAWASETTTLLGQLGEDAQIPDVVVNGDIEFVFNQVWGDHAVSTQHLQPFYRRVRSLVDRCDATYRCVDSSENIAEDLLPTG